MSFLKKIFQSNNDSIAYLKGTSGVGSKNVFLLLNVHRHKIAELFNKKEGDTYNPLEYGKLLYFGFGEQPSEHDRNFIEEKYGISLDKII